MKKQLLNFSLIAVFFIIGSRNIVIGQTMSDYEGNIYNTITIGTQTWMKENLKSKKYNDGTDIKLVTDSTQWVVQDSGAYCFFKNNETQYKDFYGAMYNFFAVKTGKLCPMGWHVPSKAEWTILLDYLSANGYNYDGTTISNKVAIAMSEYADWYPSTGMGCVGNDDYLSLHNATGFSARPAGYRFPITYSYSYGWAKIRTAWWSTDEFNSAGAYVTMIENSDPVVNQPFAFNEAGYSCRCLSNSSGINDNNSKIEFNIYPNPSDGYVKIETGRSQNTLLQIIDMHGKIVIEKQFTGTTEIELPSKGIYAVKISDGSNIVLEKLVIQ